MSDNKDHSSRGVNIAHRRVQRGMLIIDEGDNIGHLENIKYTKGDKN